MKSYIRGLLIAILLWPCVASAQKKTDTHITGHVVDKITGEHLPYSTISISGTTVGCAGDASGHFLLKDVPLGELEVTASSVGYGTARQTVKTTPDKTFELKFELTKEHARLDEVVVTANRNESKKEKSATVVNVIPSALFSQTASNNVAEGLNFQSGMRVEQSCQNCGVPQLRINGLEGQYSQILLDSRPIFSSLATVYGLEQLPAGMIERVEVVRGGGSALFGSNAIGGVVNIITKEPLRNSFSLSNNLGILDKGAIDNQTTLNGAYVSEDFKTGIYLFGMIKRRDGYDRNGDGFTEVPTLGSETIGFRGYHKLSNYARLTAEYHHIREYRRGGDLLDRPPHEANIAEQLRHNINGGGLKLDLFTKNGAGRASIFSSAQGIDRESYFGTDQNPDAYGSTDDFTSVTGAQYTHSFAKAWFMPSDLTAGIEYNYNKLHDQMLGYHRDIRQTSTILGAYLQNEWKNDKLTFLVGARLDKHNKVERPIFSPRLNLRYTPIENVALRASYSSGYRAPQAYEEDLHVAAVGGEVALISIADNLKPEYSNSFSASADLYRTVGKVSLNLLIEGFYTNLKDVFILEEKGYDAAGNLLLERRNGSGATVKGINTELRVRISDKFDAQLGYTYQQSRYKEPERWSENEKIAPQRRMLRSPDSYGYLTLRYNPAERLQLSLTGNYTGRMLVPHFAGYVEQDEEVLTPRFVDMGARVSYVFDLSQSLKLEAAVGMKNILNSFQRDLDIGSKRDAGFIYGPALPRTTFFTIKVYL